MNGDQEITGVALTSSGRILLVGRVPSAGGLLIRLRPDGTPDDTFGSWGVAAGGAMWSHNRPVIQPDGKIVVPGATFGFPGGRVAVTRHHSTGGIDSSFAGDGTANSFHYGEAFDAVVQPDGKIVVAGLGQTWPGDLLIAFAEEPMRRLTAVVLRRLGGSYGVMARVRQDDDTQENTPFVPIDDGPHAIELDWGRASGPDALDGALELWIDGVSVATLTGLDNSDGVDFVRLGALSLKSGASGTLFWDEFESRRESYIGP